MTGSLIRILEAQLLAEEVGDLTLEDFCQRLQSPPKVVEALVAYGVIQPGGRLDERIFSAQELRRARVGLRLQRDLELNWAGVALALELIERLENLERQVALLGANAGR